MPADLCSSSSHLTSTKRNRTEIEIIIKLAQHDLSRTNDPTAPTVNSALELLCEINFMTILRGKTFFSTNFSFFFNITDKTSFRLNSSVIQ